MADRRRGRRIAAGRRGPQRARTSPASPVQPAAPSRSNAASRPSRPARRTRRCAATIVAPVSASRRCAAVVHCGVARAARREHPVDAGDVVGARASPSSRADDDGALGDRECGVDRARRWSADHARRADGGRGGAAGRRRTRRRRRSGAGRRIRRARRVPAHGRAASRTGPIPSTAVHSGRAGVRWHAGQRSAGGRTPRRVPSSVADEDLVAVCERGRRRADRAADWRPGTGACSTVGDAVGRRRGVVRVEVAVGRADVQHVATDDERRRRRARPTAAVLPERCARGRVASRMHPGRRRRRTRARRRRPSSSKTRAVDRRPGSSRCSGRASADHDGRADACPTSQPRCRGDRGAGRRRARPCPWSRDTRSAVTIGVERDVTERDVPGPDVLDERRMAIDGPASGVRRECRCRTRASSSRTRS